MKTFLVPLSKQNSTSKCARRLTLSELNISKLMKKRMMCKNQTSKFLLKAPCKSHVHLHATCK